MNNTKRSQAKTWQSDWALMHGGAARGLAWINAHPLFASLIAVVIVWLLVLAFFAIFPSWAPRYTKWTGFGVRPNPQFPTEELPPRRLWDWMDLLIVPVFIAGAAAWLGYLQQKRELAERHTDREIAEAARANAERIERDRQEQRTLQSYFDRMGELLLNHDFGQHAENKVPHTIVRARTFTVLENVNGKRRGLVLRFLYESDLITTPAPVVDLRNANLREANLVEAHLAGAHLAGAVLVGADLVRANLSGANLREAKFGNALMKDARLEGTIAREAKFPQAEMTGASLVSGDFTNAYFVGTDLDMADFRRAILTGAYFKGVDLNGAHSDTGTVWPDGFEPDA